MSSTSNYMVKERDLPERLGVSRDYMRECRQEHLAQGMDWELVGREVCLTGAGAEKLAEMLGILPKKKPGSPASAVNAPSGAVQSESQAGKVVLNEVASASDGLKLESPSETRLVVARANWPNPHILTAQLWTAKQKGAVVTVKVRDNANFRRGMEIKARRVNETTFELVGRCPRWPGKW